MPAGEQVNLWVTEVATRHALTATTLAGQIAPHFEIEVKHAGGHRRREAPTATPTAPTRTTTTTDRRLRFPAREPPSPLRVSPSDASPNTPQRPRHRSERHDARPPRRCRPPPPPPLPPAPPLPPPRADPRAHCAGAPIRRRGSSAWWGRAPPPRATPTTPRCSSTAPEHLRAGRRTPRSADYERLLREFPDNLRAQSAQFNRALPPAREPPARRSPTRCARRRFLPRDPSLVHDVVPRRGAFGEQAQQPAWVVELPDALLPTPASSLPTGVEVRASRRRASPATSATPSAPPSRPSSFAPTLELQSRPLGDD